MKCRKTASKSEALEVQTPSRNAFAQQKKKLGTPIGVPSFFGCGDGI
jgi:hypothetical protein